MNNHDIELVDIVDSDDNVIETVTRTELRKRGTRHFRVAAAFIKNKNGQLWMPKYTELKGHGWGLVGGCVQSGESYEQAFTRETKEEIGIDVTTVVFKELGYFQLKDGAAAFKKMFEIQLEEVAWFDTAEFSSAQWMSPQEVLERHRRGERMLPDIPWMVERFYCSH